MSGHKRMMKWTSKLTVAEFDKLSGADQLKFTQMHPNSYPAKRYRIAQDQLSALENSRPVEDESVVDAQDRGDHSDEENEFEPVFYQKIEATSGGIKEDAFPYEGAGTGPFTEDRRGDKPGLHLLYVKWACRHLQIIDDALRSLWECSNLNMHEPALALQRERAKLVNHNAAYSDANEILFSLGLKEGARVAKLED